MRAQESDCADVMAASAESRMKATMFDIEIVGRKRDAWFNNAVGAFLCLFESTIYVRRGRVCRHGGGVIGLHHG